MAFNAPYKQTLIQVLLLAALVGNLSGMPYAGIPVTRALERSAWMPRQFQISASADLSSFIDQVRNGDAHTLVGVYVPHLFALPVVQQPAEDTTFVASIPDVITQFGMVSRHGGVGLLAHNTLAGANFYRLEMGQLIAMVYGDGSLRLFRVDRIRQFQALDPENAYSDFIDLANPGQKLTSGQVFNDVYGRSGQLVFQTCLERDGNYSWGRIFVVATPVSSAPFVN